MKILYCWRCKMEVPMLEDEELQIAQAFYKQGIKNVAAKSRTERFKLLLDYYNELTGFGETEPHAIMHHAVALYGPPCENCGKPYRTPLAKLCVACGNKRLENI